MVYWLGSEVTRAMDHRSTSFSSSAAQLLIYKWTKKMVFMAIPRWNMLKFRLKLNGRIARISKTYCSMDVIYLLRSNHCPNKRFELSKGSTAKIQKNNCLWAPHFCWHILAKKVTPFRSRNFECSWFHSLMEKSHSQPALKIIKFCCLTFSGIDEAQSLDPVTWLCRENVAGIFLFTN